MMGDLGFMRSELFSWLRGREWVGAIRGPQKGLSCRG